MITTEIKIINIEPVTTGKSIYSKETSPNKAINGLAAAGGLLTMVVGSLQLFTQNQNEEPATITTLLTSDSEKKTEECDNLKDYYQSFYCSLRKTSLVIKDEYENYIISSSDEE